MKTEVAEEISRMWANIPVVEATEALRVFLLPEDLKGAIRQDPLECAFVRALRRSCGAKRAVFLKSIAYIELMRPDGALVIERFKMPKNMRQIIEIFDRTGACPSGGFMLHPPTGSYTLEGKKLRAKRREAAIIGTAKKKATSRKGTTVGKPITVDGLRIMDDVRHGSGQVHFISRTPSRSASNRSRYSDHG